MKRSELNALKAKAAQRKAMAVDLEKLVAMLMPLLSVIGKLLPEEIKKLLEKYGHKE